MAATVRSGPRPRRAGRGLGGAAGLIRLGGGLGFWRWAATPIRIAGGSPDDSGLRALFRYFAVRDVALGVATLASSRPGGDVPRVLTLQGVADTVDGAVVGGLVAAGRLERIRGNAAVALAAGSALVEYAAAWQLRRSSAHR